ncbi:MAG: hypothetical protein AABZ31_10445 [Bdellovibrionota bacterium]
MKTLNKIVALQLLAVLALSQFGCGKSKSKGSDHTVQIRIKPRTSDQAQYTASEPLATDALTDDRKALAEKINKGEAVSFSEITELFILDHADEFIRLTNTDKNDRLILHDEIFVLAEQTKNMAPLKKKAAYEKVLEDRAEGKKIVYQKDAVTMMHVTLRGEMQCFSGTSLYLAVTRFNSSVADYRKENYVVIIEPGHVLPGKMVLTEGGYRLLGIETTGIGDAIKDMGLAKNLSGPKRVIDAEHFVLAKVLEKSLSGAKGESFLAKALQEAAIKYDLPLEKLELAVAAKKKQPIGPVPDGYVLKGGSAGKSDLNSTLFSFSPAILPAEAMARREIGETAESIEVKVGQQVTQNSPQIIPVTSIPSNPESLTQAVLDSLRRSAKIKLKSPFLSIGLQVQYLMNLLNR